VYGENMRRARRVHFGAILLRKLYALVACGVRTLFRVIEDHRKRGYRLPD
jgi:hypothetical protein